MDLLGIIFDALPWWLALVVALAATVALAVFSGKLPPWAGPLLSMLRASALARLFRLGKPIASEPQALDPERSPGQPDALAVDSAGTPVGTRPESELSQGGEG